MKEISECIKSSKRKRGVLLESISFPAGKHLLIRGVISKMKTTPAAAASELSLFLAGNSSRDHIQQIESALSDATKEWLLFFKDALSQMSEEFPIPRRIFYTSDEDIGPWFGRVINENNQEEGRSFKLTCLNDSFLKSYVSVIDPAFRDPFIEIETIFAHKLTQLKNK
jgi:hypothetical protein